jgi:hypothetical protein
MVAVLQANQRAELPPNENEKARSSYNSIARQRLGEALRYCNDATYALMEINTSANGLTDPALRTKNDAALPISFRTSTDVRSVQNVLAPFAGFHHYRAGGVFLIASVNKWPALTEF